MRALLALLAARFSLCVLRSQVHVYVYVGRCQECGPHGCVDPYCSRSALSSVCRLPDRAVARRAASSSPGGSGSLTLPALCPSADACATLSTARLAIASAAAVRLAARSMDS